MRGKKPSKSEEKREKATPDPSLKGGEEYVRGAVAEGDTLR